MRTSTVIIHGAAEMPLPPDSSIAATQTADLYTILGSLRPFRKLILLLTLIGACLGVALSLLSTRHVGEGMLLTQGLTAIDYKRYESLLINDNHLRHFLQQQGAPVNAQLQPLLDSPGALRKAISPAFAFTDQDQRTFGVRAGVEDSSQLIGIRLRIEQDTATGGAALEALNHFVRDTLIRADLERLLLDACQTQDQALRKLRNDQLQNAFQIAEEERRTTGLRELLNRQRPVSSPAGEQQLVTIEKGNERYLSLTTQLNASEVLIADLKLGETRRQRSEQAATLKHAYYCAALQRLQTPIDGLGLLALLPGMQESSFASHDRSLDIVEHTWNELELQRTDWENTYLRQMRLASPAANSEAEIRSPGLTLGAVIGAAFGAVVSLLVALLRPSRKHAGKRGD